MTTETIGTVCKRFSSGKGIAAKSIQPSGLYPVIGANGLRGYTGTFNFDGRCAVIGRQGAYCGNVRYFEGKAFMTEHAIVAEANENNDSGYLAYKLQEMNLAQYQGQSAQPGLSVNTLSSVRIEMPDLQTQVKVFNILHKLDDKISNNNVISSQLETLAKTIYDYWFLQFEFPNDEGKPYKSSGGKMVWNEELKREIPEGWEVKTLDTLCTFGNGINYDKDCIGDKEYKIVNVRNITASSLLINSCDLDHITLSSKQADKYIVNDNDILIARSGTPGAVRLLLDNENTIYCGFIIHCLPINSEHRLYLTYAIKQFEGSAATTTGGSILQNVSQDTLKSLNIIVPPIDIIKKFNKTITIYIDRMQQLIKENQQLTSLRDFLLPLLMNGQVTFKDEAASEEE